MAVPTMQLETLVVRLVGDSSNFDFMIQGMERRAIWSMSRLSNFSKGFSSSLGLPILVATGLMIRQFSKFDDAVTRSVTNLEEQFRRIMRTDLAVGLPQLPLAGTEMQRGLGEQLMNQVNYSRFRDAARKQIQEGIFSISRESITSPQALAESYYNLSRSGVSAAQSLDILRIAEKFAVATGGDVVRSTTLLVDAQAALGLSSASATTNMANMTRIADVLTAASSMANVSAEDLATSLTGRLGNALRFSNKSLEEGVGLFLAFRQAGLPTHEALSAEEMMLRGLRKAIDDHSKAWAEMHVNLVDTKGTMLPIAEIVGGLETRFKGWSDEVRIAALHFLGFDARTSRSILSLIGHSKLIDENRKMLLNVGGTLDRVRDANLKTFGAQFEISRNIIHMLMIEIAEYLIPIIRSMNNMLRDSYIWWSSLHPQVKTTMVTIVGITFALQALGGALALTGILLRFVGGGLLIPFTLLAGFVRMVALGVGLLLTPFAALIAILGGVVLLITGLPKGGFRQLWEDLKRGVDNFSVKATGFIVNFAENMDLLMKWIDPTWNSLWAGMGDVMGTAMGNMLANVKTTWVLMGGAFHYYVIVPIEGLWSLMVIKLGAAFRDMFIGVMESITRQFAESAVLGFFFPAITAQAGVALKQLQMLRKFNEDNRKSQEAVLKIWGKQQEGMYEATKSRIGTEFKGLTEGRKLNLEPLPKFNLRIPGVEIGRPEPLLQMGSFGAALAAQPHMQGFFDALRAATKEGTLIGTIEGFDKGMEDLTNLTELKHPGTVYKEYNLQRLMLEGPGGLARAPVVQEVHDKQLTEAFRDFTRKLEEQKQQQAAPGLPKKP